MKITRYIKEKSWAAEYSDDEAQIAHDFNDLLDRGWSCRAAGHRCTQLIDERGVSVDPRLIDWLEGWPIDPDEVVEGV